MPASFATSQPADFGEQWTPSDSVAFPDGRSASAFRVANAGDVNVEYENGTTHIIQNVLPGEHVPVRIKKILLTGTSATGIDVFYHKAS